MRQPTQLLAIRLEDGYRAGLIPELFRPFEGYRSPQRQVEMLESKTSKAGPFESAHQYGLAVDFVPVKNGKENAWHWPEADAPCWDFLRANAVNRGLLNDISWDRPHIEHPLWRDIRRSVIR